MAVTDSINCACSDASGNRTLKQLRDGLVYRLGFGAQVGSLPPGVLELLNSFLDGAQRALYRRYSILRTERYFSWPLTTGVNKYELPKNAEATPLPTPVNAVFATSTTGGTLAAGTYWYRVSAVNANGETLASPETSITTTGATSTVTVNWAPVVAPAGVSAVTGYRIYGRTAGAEQLLASVGLVTSYLSMGAVTPAGALPTANTTAGCTRTLDPRRVSWVGMERSGVWYPLVSGIAPELYGNNMQGFPQRYAIRQCILLWPAPSDAVGNLIVRGDFGLDAFALDTDTATVDDELVFLLALANAKAHYGQPDANNYVAQMETMMRNLVAGSHQASRYLPGRGRDNLIYTQPAPTTPFP